MARAQGKGGEGRGDLRRRAVLLCALFCGALALRLAHVASIRDMPFFSRPVGDGQSYWVWAGRLAGGDWIGEGVFYQAPLYPYLVGVARWLSGAGPECVYVAQSALGAAACVLTALAGRAFFSLPSGLAAGVMLALYPPAIFYDGVIQKASLDVFLASLLLWLSARRPETGLLRRAATGAALGLLCLTRENALALAPVGAVWEASFSGRPGWGARAVRAGAFVLGLGLALAPVAARNYAVGGELKLTTAQMGPNLYIGNGPQADGFTHPLRRWRDNPMFERQDATELAEQDLGRKLSAGEVSGYWTAKTLRFIRDNPWRWVALMAKKTALTWNALEAPDTEDFYFCRLWSPLLLYGGGVWHFGVVGLWPWQGCGFCDAG